MPQGYKIKGTYKKTFKLDVTPFGSRATDRANKISSAIGIELLENNYFKVQVFHPSKKKAIKRNRFSQAVRPPASSELYPSKRSFLLQRVTYSAAVKSFHWNNLWE